MEELTIEQKAKRYDEAIKRVENIRTGKCETTFMFTVGLFEHIFPELADSEDEKVRKALLEMVHDTTGDSLWVDYNIHKEDALAWLWKRGQTFTKKDVDDAYIKGICDAKRELEKQVMPTDIPADAVLDGNKDGLIADTIKTKGEQKPWNEDDEAILSWCISDIERAKYCRSQTKPELCDIEINWLKNIKDRVLSQPSWKPSDGQMTALRRMKAAIAGEGEIYEPLNSLYEDLKKLREE